MELGNFLGKLKGQDKQEPKKFLALVLTDEIVQASVWNVVEGVTQITAIGTPVEWDGDTGTTSELVTAVDATISSAVEGLDNEPNEVILGVPHSWTDKNGILGVKKEFIGKIRKELDLAAIGYVVITDSILSYLKMQEGTPTTSILIQVSRDELTLVLVRLGRIEAEGVIGRSDDVVEDVTEGISRLKIADNLPSRIILFNSMHDLSDIIQNLLSVDWQNEFNFLHIPKIEALPKDVAIRALSVAGGAEVAKSLGLAVVNPVIDQAEPQKESVGVDPRVDPPVAAPNLLSAKDVGFSESGDISPAKPTEKIDFIDPEDEPTTAEPEPRIDPPSKPRVPFVIPKFTLPKLSLPKLKLSLPNLKSHWWYLAAGALVLLALIFWLVWLLPQASLVVSVVPKSLEEDVDITLSTTDSSIDFAQRIIPAEVESLSESGEKMLETTGKKTIGDPSVGEVTIYNRTSALKTFTKGTQLLAQGGIKFTLDGDVTIASKSAGSDYVDVPGKANVKVTAFAIGADSNLAGGTEFTVQNFGKDSYVAKNDNAMTGGSSQEVQVVGKDDQKSLIKELTQELLETLQTKSEGGATSGTGVYLIPDSAKVENVTYSAKIGETAKTLTANLTLQATLLRYKTEDVTTLVNSTIDQAVPSGYVRSSLPSTVELSASQVSEDGSKVQGNAKVKVLLLPVVNQTSLSDFIKGQKGSALDSILRREIPGYQSAEVAITPRLIPPTLKKIPLNPTNITIQIIPAI